MTDLELTRQRTGGFIRGSPKANKEMESSFALQRLKTIRLENEETLVNRVHSKKVRKKDVRTEALGY